MMGREEGVEGLRVDTELPPYIDLASPLPRSYVMDRFRFFLVLVVTQIVEWPSRRFALWMAMLCFVFAGLIWNLLSSLPADGWWYIMHRLITDPFNSQRELFVGALGLLLAVAFGAFQCLGIFYLERRPRANAR
jgi:hypothetical protein